MYSFSRRKWRAEGFGRKSLNIGIVVGKYSVRLMLGED